MSWACKEYMSTSESTTFDSRVKQKVLNDEKRSKRQNLIPVYAAFYRSIMTLKWQFPLLGFLANWIKKTSNVFDARMAQTPGTFLSFGLLKMSSLDSVTAYI